MSRDDQETLLSDDGATTPPLEPGQSLFGDSFGRLERGAPEGHSAGDPAFEQPSADRYEILAVLGRGGMGEVYRVADHALDRTVALKILRGTPSNGRIRAFREEARLTARLQHPGIIPVHDLGVLPDGRLYFTMREVQGRTFRETCREVHANREADDFPVRLRRLVDAFRRACEAVAYAHDAGVIHRDIKPTNLMIGAFGEVMVLDWGLGLLADHAASAAGVAVGTPRYMAPEQARGETLTSAADVYALGATLRELLTGVPPWFDLDDATDVLSHVAQGRLPPLPADARDSVPDALLQLCADCLLASPTLRPQDASVLVAVLSDWLDGAQRRERGLAEVARADAHFAEARRLSAEAKDLAARAEVALAALPPAASAEERGPAWDLEDLAASCERKARAADVDGERTLRAALTHDPALPEAHQRIAARAFARHQQLEAMGRFDEASRLEPTLRTHGRGRFAAYLRGTGALTLHTDPPGATAMLFEFVPRRRRLLAVPVRELGPTPLREVPLDPGSYLVELRHPHCQTVRYPVRIGRNEHWHGIPPDSTAPEPVHLPPPGDGRDVYVPAGWYTSSSDLPWLTVRVPRQRIWCDGFFMRRLPVTFAEWRHYLDDLAAAGRHDAAAAAIPRAAGHPLLGRDADGRYQIVPDADGDLYDERWPALFITWFQARDFAAWQARRTGLPWRLPHEHEFEKAARGVDERGHPWGDAEEPTFSNNKDNPALPRLPAPVGVPDTDCSPYGVLGLAGGATTWTMDPWDPAAAPPAGRVPQAAPEEATQRVHRGGSWTINLRMCHAAVRLHITPASAQVMTGMRLVRPLQAPRVRSR